MRPVYARRDHVVVNYITLRFKTDSSGTGTGFLIAYQASSLYCKYDVKMQQRKQIIIQLCFSIFYIKMELNGWNEPIIFYLWEFFS